MQAFTLIGQSERGHADIVWDIFHKRLENSRDIISVWKSARGINKVA